MGRHVKEFHGQNQSTRSILFSPQKKAPKWTWGVSLRFARVYEVDTTEIQGYSHNENVVSSNLERVTLWFHQTWFAEKSSLSSRIFAFPWTVGCSNLIYGGGHSLPGHSCNIPVHSISFHVSSFHSKYITIFQCFIFRIFGLDLLDLFKCFLIFVSMIWTNKDHVHCKEWGAR